MLNFVYAIKIDLISQFKNQEKLLKKEDLANQLMEQQEFYGTLMNQCIHNIDLLQWMMGGEVQRVYAECDTYLRNIEAEDFGAIMIRFKNGAIGIVEGSACVYPKNLEETLSIFGEDGAVSIGGLANNELETWRFEGDDEEVIKEEVNVKIDNVYGKGHTPLFKDLIDAINEDREPLVSGEEGKKAMSIILAAYKSRKTGMPVQFPITDFKTTDMEEEFKGRKQFRQSKNICIVKG
eukprot:TRINITY_DN1802_c0_g1_i2.p1 TRINITY_DN1802_c0_g1~~TRINITY_DN1802_c0_g1_i2.p1  ORF type:complete len:236 (-),score=37.28 TRINITY_DN1802_c0_g1_i2:213-920(-)